MSVTASAVVMPVMAPDYSSINVENEIQWIAAKRWLAGIVGSLARSRRWHAGVSNRGGR